MESREQKQSVRVLIADDQRLMRDGIASLLSIQEDIEVIGTVSNGKEALEYSLETHPDVILMDIRMPIMDGVEATTLIRQQLAGCHILVLTTFDDEELIVKALRAGASGYLLKNIPATDLARAIQAVHKGIYQLDPLIASKVVASLTQTHTSSASTHLEPSTRTARTEYEEKASPEPLSIGIADLTFRELQVLRFIAKGATNREIAKNLIISEGTVKNHISSILSRLHLRDRTQAAIYAREHGLL